MMTFLVEDAAHKALLQSLGISRKEISVFGSKGNVIKSLRERPGDMGIVDEDPQSTRTQPHELANYREVGRGEGLRLLAREGHNGQRLAILCPRIEDWLIQRAKLSNIDPTRHYLPSTPKELKQMPHYEEKEGFRRFLEELKERDGGMRLLRQWVHQAESQLK
jgi:hypothetical protein